MFPTGDKEMVRAMLSSSLQGVVAQTLLKKPEGGRVGAFEILVGTNAVRNLIRENQIPQLYSMMQTGSRYGMITMQDAIRDLLESDVIDKSEAHRVLLAVSDEDGESTDKDYAAASLGGGKIGEEAGSAGGSSADGGYSF